MPKSAPNVPSDILHPRSTWADTDAYDVQATLGRTLPRNDATYELSDEVRAAGPRSTDASRADNTAISTASAPFRGGRGPFLTVVYAEIGCAGEYASGFGSMSLVEQARNVPAMTTRNEF